MKEKIDEIIDQLKGIRNSTGEGIMVFLCFISSCTTCNYMREMKEEQHTTNLYLKMDYNHHNPDTTYMSDAFKLETKKSKTK